MLYYAYDRTLQAVNAFNGETIWSYSNGPYFSSPAYGNNNIYIGETSKNLIAVNAETGKKIWEFTASDQVRLSPTYGDGFVYFSTSIPAGKENSESYFYALDATTGAKKWEYKYGGFLSGNPLYIDNKIIFSEINVGIVCLNAKNGQLLWNKPGASEYDGSTRTNNSYHLFYNGK